MDYYIWKNYLIISERCVIAEDATNKEIARASALQQKIE
jgi:hypothetical protein